MFDQVPLSPGTGERDGVDYRNDSPATVAMWAVPLPFRISEHAALSIFHS